MNSSRVIDSVNSSTLSLNSLKSEEPDDLLLRRVAKIPTVAVRAMVLTTAAITFLVLSAALAACAFSAAAAGGGGGAGGGGWRGVVGALVALS